MTQEPTTDDSLQSPAARFFNRELSWLGFNTRVLAEAMNERVPLLERVRFLAIAARNLDEFFQVRVGGLRFASEKGSRRTGIAGMTVGQQLEKIRTRVAEFTQLQYGCYLDELGPALEEAGFRRLKRGALTARQIEHLDRLFSGTLKSLIHVRACGRGQGFPWLQGAAVCLLVRLGSGGGILPHIYEMQSDSSDRYLLIPLPENTHRLVFLPSDPEMHYMLLEDVIAMYLSQICPQEQIVETASIRVIRNADFELNEEAADFFHEMQQLLNLREASKCVRLEVSETASPEMQGFLREVLGVEEQDVYLARGPLGLADLMELANQPGFPRLNFPVWETVPAPEFQTGDTVFETIAKGDRILLHPWQSYEPVLRFLEEAAADDRVLAIKQTLYRTSRDSRIIRALVTAAEKGKNVSAVVELKARFDESRNMSWARQLERNGVHVLYGVRGLKTHAKLCIVVRDEPDGLRRYVHFATGNYNESTASLYTDVSFFTCDDQLGNEAVDVFNSITGLTVPPPFSRLAVAPINLRETLLQLIRVETLHAGGGLRAAISAKMNSLVDAEIIEALYKASQAGVEINLNVRGICSLLPGVPGLSENIRVVSIVDRYLEHARIYRFHHGGDPKLFIGSADWMTRNLDNRIELMIPVEDRACRRTLEYVLDACLRDNVNAWQILPDGSHRRLTPERARPFRSQERLRDYCREQYMAATNPGVTAFEPLRPESDD